jgi:uncharacterized membrane protein YczE
MLGRALRLVAGCVLLGTGVALMVRARLGLDPWSVFHQGLSHHLGLPIGTTGIVVGIVVLTAWAPLRQRVGVGTAVNVAVVGLTIDGVLAHTADPAALPVRVSVMAAGVVLAAAGTGLYIGARFGPGPRDGLMTSLAARSGRPIGAVRGAIEVTVLAAGFLLGGQVGIGTLAFALAIGPLVQLFLGRFTVALPVGVPGPAPVPARPETLLTLTPPAD